MKNSIKPMTVNQMISNLEKFKKYGYGETEVFFGFPTKLGFGVESVRVVECIKTDTLFGKDIIYFKLQ